jgi:hypothetical protein
VYLQEKASAVRQQVDGRSRVSNADLFSKLEPVLLSLQQWGWHMATAPTSPVIDQSHPGLSCASSGKQNTAQTCAFEYTGSAHSVWYEN